MNILSIIAARSGSKGIPMKNLIILNQKPLLYYTVKASMDSKLISKTIVSTDSDRIAKVARKFGAEVIMRPKRLASDKAQVELTVMHVLQFLKSRENYVPHILVLLSNTSPLRSSKHIDEALKFFFNKKYDSVLSGFSAHKFLWKAKDSVAYPINYDPKKRPNRQEMKDQFIENGAIYITKNELFEKSKCRISGRIGLYQMSEELSIEIDSHHDLSLAEQTMTLQKN